MHIYEIMSSRKDLIREIEENIEENFNAMVKAAFYSDPEVEQIVMELYKRWEAHGYRGVPLDYASLEELEILAIKARYYRQHPMPVPKIGVASKEEFKERPRRGLRRWFRNFIRTMFGI
mgnify:CR=1 FL=1